MQKDRRAYGGGKGCHQHRQGEQLLRAGAHNLQQQPGHNAPPHHQHQHPQGDKAQGGSANGPGDRRRVYPFSALHQPGNAGEQDENEHSEKVFDHQPPHGNVPVHGAQHVVVGKHAQEHNGAGYREAKPQHNARGQGKAEPGARENAAHGGGSAL